MLAQLARTRRVLTDIDSALTTICNESRTRSCVKFRVRWLDLA